MSGLHFVVVAVVCALIIAPCGSQKAVYIGGKNSVEPSTYAFKIVKLSPAEQHNPSYSHLMIVACKRFGMKPVCDHADYCRRDYRALYIGQTSHLAYKGVMKGRIIWENLHNCQAEANGGIRSTGGGWTSSYAYSHVEKTESDVSVTWRFLARGEAMLGFDCGGDVRSIYKKNSCHYFIVSFKLNLPPPPPTSCRQRTLRHHFHCCCPSLVFAVQTYQQPVVHQTAGN